MNFPKIAQEMLKGIQVDTFTRVFVCESIFNVLHPFYRRMRTELKNALCGLALRSEREKCVSKLN